MQNSEDVNFDSFLGGDLGGDWELLDDSSTSIEFTEPTPPVKKTATPKKVEPIKDSEEEEDEDFSFENDFEEEEDEPIEGGEDESEEVGEDEGLYDYLAKALAEKGILALEDGTKIESDEDLYAAIQNTITNGIEAYKGSLGEESRMYIEFLEKGGNPAVWQSVAAQEDYSDMNLDTDDAKKEVILAFYKEKGFSDSKARRLVEDAEDADTLDDDVEEAKEFFKQRKEKALQRLAEEREAEVQARIQQEQEFADNLTKYIETSQDVRNFPLTSAKQKQELKDYLFKKTVPVKQPNGDIIKVSQYYKDKLDRQADLNTRFEDIVFDALVLKEGIEPIKKKTISDRNRKLVELAKNEKSRSTSSKLAGSGGKSRPGSKSRYTWEDLD